MKLSAAAVGVQHSKLVTELLLIALICTSFDSKPCEAAICTPHPPGDVNSPKGYLSSLLDTSIELKAATHRAVELSAAKTAMDEMAVFENASEEYDCAASYLDPYAKSTNQAVSTSALSYGVAIAKLHAIVETARQQFRDMLDGKMPKQSEQADRAGKLEVEGQDAWHLQMNAVLASCMDLVEFRPDKTQGLALTHVERAEFIARIREGFGNPSSKATVQPLDSSMILLRDSLADEKSRPSHVAL